MPAGYRREAQDPTPRTSEKRTVITNLIQYFPQPECDEAVAEVAMVAHVANNVSPDAAEAKAWELLNTGLPTFTGARDTCILSWSFEDRPMWMGPHR